MHSEPLGPVFRNKPHFGIQMRWNVNLTVLAFFS